MPIEYGEFTISHNPEDKNILTNIMALFCDSETISYNYYHNSDIVILFEDGEIYEVNNNIKDFTYKFAHSIISYPVPLYFEKNQKKNEQTYFKKSPVLNDKGNKCVKMENLFKTYTKFSHKNNLPSAFNCIYYRHIYNPSINNSEVFGIVKLKSSESIPRFQFAFDSDEFNKEEVMYLINYILKYNKNKIIS